MKRNQVIKRIVKKHQVNLKIGKRDAYYPASDKVTIKRGPAAAMDAAALHEIGHWTAKRMGRTVTVAEKALAGGAEMKSYAAEEVTAELICQKILAKCEDGGALIEASNEYIYCWAKDANLSNADLNQAHVAADAAVKYLLGE